jgi:hypothetical protein
MRRLSAYAVYVCMCVRLVSVWRVELFLFIVLLSISVIIHHKFMPKLYKHSCYTNIGPSNEPQKTKCHFYRKLFRFD